MPPKRRKQNENQRQLTLSAMFSKDKTSDGAQEPITAGQCSGPDHCTTPSPQMPAACQQDPEPIAGPSSAPDSVDSSSNGASDGRMITDTEESRAPLPCSTKKDTQLAPTARYFQSAWLSKYCWLRYDKERCLMFCSLCETAQKDNVLAVGCNNFRTSTLTRHVAHPDHQLLLVSRQLKPSAQVMWTKGKENEAAAAVTAMKAFYYCVKEFLPLTKYTSLIALFREVKAENIQHLQAGPSTDYSSSYTALEFLEAMSMLFDDQTTEKLKSASAISILCDESTDVSVHKRLVIWARVVNMESPGPQPETLYLRDVQLEAGDAKAIASALFQELEARGISVSQVMGLGSDGASVMVGKVNGVAGLLLRKNPRIVTVHCMAHRLALATSQAAEKILQLKEFKETLTLLFYYFSKSSSRTQNLEEIQKVLEAPVLKIQKIHDIRWLSFYEALLSVHKNLVPLMVYFDSLKKQKDPKGEGLARKVNSYSFVYYTCLLLDVLTPLTVLSQALQKKNLDPSRADVHVEQCRSDLNLLVDNPHRCQHLSALEQDCHLEEKTYKQCKITVQKVSSTLLPSFVEEVLSNLKKRFPDMELLQAFKVLAMRPISFVDKNKLDDWGMEEMEKLLQQFADEKTHSWEGEKSTSTEPFINREETMDEWRLLKRTVLSEQFPRDDFVTLWQAICTFYPEDFPNLKKLTACALTLPVHTADCERSFSVQNYIHTQRRSALTNTHCDQLMRVCIDGPSFQDMPFMSAVQVWAENRRRYLFKK